MQVSFTFTCQIDGKLIPIDSFPRSSVPSLSFKGPPIVKERIATRGPQILTTSTGLNRPFKGPGETFITPDKSSLRVCPLSRKSPTTPQIRPTSAPTKRLKIAPVSKARRSIATSKHSSDDESSASYSESEDDDSD